MVAVQRHVARRVTLAALRGGARHAARRCECGALGWDLGMGMCVGFVGFCSEISGLYAKSYTFHHIPTHKSHPSGARVRRRCGAHQLREAPACDGEVVLKTAPLHGFPLVRH
jgi:hypothetical protein